MLAVIAAAVLLTLAALAAGRWILGPAQPAIGTGLTGPVITGTVTAVDETASSACVHSDQGMLVCSIPFQQRGAAPLYVGERVQVQRARVETGPATSVEIMIVTSPAPTLSVPPKG